MTFSISKNIFRLCLLALLPLLFSCGGDTQNNATGDKVTLQFNPEENTQYRFSSDVKQTVTVMGMGNTQNMLMEYIYKVTGADGNNKKIQITYDRFKMDMMYLGEQIVYDSKDPNSDRSIYGAMDSLLGKPFVVTIDPSGKILNLEGWNTNGAKSLIDDQTIQQMVETNFNIYPDSPVAIGEQWSRDVTTNVQMMAMSVKAQYTLKDVKDNIATLKMEGDIVMDSSADTVKDKDVRMKMNMSGKQTGDMQVELKTGRIISANIKQNIKGSMKMGGQETPMEMNSDIRLSSEPL